jgi:hypothetical protein
MWIPSINEVHIGHVIPLFDIVYMFGSCKLNCINPKSFFIQFGCSRMSLATRDFLDKCKQTNIITLQSLYIYFFYMMLKYL